jgi:hypothetical protein
LSRKRAFVSLRIKRPRRCQSYQCFGDTTAL